MRDQRVGQVRRRIGRLAVAGLLVATLGTGGAGAGTGVAAAAVAPGGTGEEIAVSGSFSAVGSFESTTDCPSFHTIHDGEGTWEGLGDVTFDLDYCVELDLSGPSPLSGTIAITAAGGTLTGSVEGEIAAVGGPQGYPADYAVTFTGGTDAYEGATGALDIAGLWDAPDIPVLSMHGTVSGTVVLPAPELPHPTSIGDCLGGGWRDVVDDAGEPFRGPLHCIFYVLTHR
jgi:hypothetical protein